MEQRYIDILFRLGESLFLDSKSKKVLKDIDDGYYIYSSVHWQEQKVESYTDTELVNIFRGLIIAEQCYTNLAGSASAATLFYREIEVRKLDKDLLIGNWAYVNTRNLYVPFGSAGGIRARSKDAFEYLSNQLAYSDLVKSEKEHKVIRMLREKTIGLENKIFQQRKEIEELKSRLQISGMNNIELAQLIINDDIRPVYFYCYEIERLMSDKSIGIEFLVKILGKFKDKEKRNTRLLKNKLIEEIDSR